MLADFIGKEVRLEGKFNGYDNRYSNRYTVAVERVRVFDLNGDAIGWDKDHTWLQEAWKIKDIPGLKIGNRLSCIATVIVYTKQSGESDIGFTNPRAI